MTRYATRNEAIQAEIIDAIEATGVATADEYDIEAIADKVLEYHAPTNDKGQQLLHVSGYQLRADMTTDEFWGTVAENEVA